MSQSVTPGAIAHTFTFSSKALRVIMRDGNPWFVASDVCEAIGITNYRNAVEKLDDDEKGVHSVDTLGGAQEMLIVNESGLNAIILRCRDAMTPGTPAHKYRKWVTSEVLPAIRKTGRYIDPNAPGATTQPAASVVEYLNGSDLQNIKRMIGFCTRMFQHQESWNQGIWFYLRQATGVPSPHQFKVEHLPVLASELQRMHAISWQVQEIIQGIETQAARRILRKGEAPDLVLADLKRLSEQAMLELKDDIAKLPSYFQREHQALAQRTPNPAGVNYGTDEKPDYFDPTKTV